MSLRYTMLVCGGMQAMLAVECVGAHRLEEAFPRGCK